MPRRTTPSEKWLAGTLRPDRNRPGPRPRRLTRTPRPPADLSPAAAGHWRNLARLLVQNGTLTDGDLPALADLCEILARLKECEREISKYGLLLPGRGGGLVKNPLLAVQKEYRLAAWRGLGRFGLTPSDRPHAAAVPADASETLEAVLARAILAAPPQDDELDDADGAGPRRDDSAEMEEER